MSRRRPKRKKNKLPDPVPGNEPVIHKNWDIYKNKFKNGVLIDGRSGESKFYRGGRKRDIPLEKFDSWEDKKKEADLFRRWKAGEFDKKDSKK